MAELKPLGAMEKIRNEYIRRFGDKIRGKVEMV